MCMSACVCGVCADIYASTHIRAYDVCRDQRMTLSSLLCHFLRPNRYPETPTPHKQPKPLVTRNTGHSSQKTREEAESKGEKNSQQGSQGYMERQHRGTLRMIPAARVSASTD